MFGSNEVSYHQTYSAKDWLSILRTTHPTQNLQRKHRTDLQMKILIRQRNHSTLQFVALASKLPVVAAEEWV